MLDATSAGIAAPSQPRLALGRERVPSIDLLSLCHASARVLQGDRGGARLGRSAPVVVPVLGRRDVPS
ncbi:hypothetical protein BDA96_05G161500 [Sorghum bicolor]|uniref:Uncharacterized protein n=2 Tax=Sorghum bicolor TaxID=4558 RepID=A0A921QYC5_SORBI|nr:hypothetical protein BDA96_05G161500 [Sorghum bicolor]KXG28648.1 hypothetical protein SORBI_3005G148000 [Sorghum bicolor]